MQGKNIWKIYNSLDFFQFIMCDESFHIRVHFWEKWFIFILIQPIQFYTVLTIEYISNVLFTSKKSNK